MNSTEDQAHLIEYLISDIFSVLYFHFFFIKPERFILVFTNKMLEKQYATKISSVAIN